MKFSEMIVKSEREIGNIGLEKDFEINKLRYNSKLVEQGDIFSRSKALDQTAMIIFRMRFLKELRR